MFNAHFNALLTTGLVALLTVLASSVSFAADVDPTRPFGVSGTNSNNPVNLVKHDDSLIVNSIVHGNGIHTAVINGKIYKILDYVGEYRITAINSHNVILRSQSKRLKINLFKSKGFKSNVVGNTVAN